MKFLKWFTREKKAPKDLTWTQAKNKLKGICKGHHRTIRYEVSYYGLEHEEKDDDIHIINQCEIYISGEGGFYKGADWKSVFKKIEQHLENPKKTAVGGEPKDEDLPF